MANWGFLTPENAPGSLVVSRITRLPQDSEYLALVGGALYELACEGNWEKFGAQDIEDTADFFRQMYLNWVAGEVSMLGSIHAMAVAETPAGMLVCDGSEHDRLDYPELYSVLHSEFLVDADTFVTPDLEAAFILGAGGGFDVNDTGGAENVQLTTDEMPEHTHTAVDHNHSDAGHLHNEITATPTLIAIGAGVPAPSAIPGIGSTGAGYANIQNSSVTINNSGGDESHENMPPYVTLRYYMVAE